jgi:hypothetical protein
MNKLEIKIAIHFASVIVAIHFAVSIAMLIDFLLLFCFYFACIIIATFVYACP